MNLKILTPISGIKPAKDKADYIVDISKAMEADLFVLHIAAPGTQGGPDALAIFEEGAKTKNVNYQGAMREGPIVESISSYADEIDADLIIMGASAGKVIEEWMMADFIVRSKRPMVIIPFGFEGAFDE